MVLLEDVKYQDGYKVWCRFSTGETGVADLKDTLWGPVFEPLKNLEEFRKFQLSSTLHTIVWENGADIAPESLYEKAVGKLELKSA
jgi:hypothetical protein